ncbi:hypothetical protein O6H91_01G141800 [Diphasiastrum complanatum]|uniref:Uncharacterized protein n=2 Tax=Diphasiastrum complanatum TaxID=34168 RepID=A0ACC2EX45_DIPCM|nr:hypothetical protein O6H91_01G061200 [Diphasiastrum complanatum]KAJ7570951.1 hypothetical protein O6H91_01G141800 [Diphasiastrum complanatum]
MAATEGRGGFVAMLFSLLLSFLWIFIRSLSGSISLASRLLLFQCTSAKDIPCTAKDVDDEKVELWSGNDGGRPNGEGSGGGGTTPPVSKLCAFYEGVVVHVRSQPILRKFSYKVRHALIRLDDHPPWFEASAHHHMSLKQAQSIACTNGSVYLLTVPSSFGYEQNPISLYYCYDHGAEVPVKCIAEVTNTPWGERVTFVFDPKSDVIAKALHVSPFMDALGQWKIQASPPGQHLVLKISVEHPRLGNYFLATLTTKRVQNTVQDADAFFWLMPQRVAVWIYWQALLLYWKGVAFVPHPKYAFDSCMGPWPQSKEVESLCKDEAHLDKLKEARPVTTHQNSLPANGQRFCAWREASSFPWK